MNRKRIHRPAPRRQDRCWLPSQRLSGKGLARSAGSRRTWLADRRSAGTADAVAVIWPELESPGLPERPEFPIHVLPEPLRGWAHSEAIATQTPVDLAAMLGLAVAAACVAKRVEFAVRCGWIEPLNLYVVVMLEPANRKSGVFSDATAPLRDFERKELERLATAIRDYRVQVRVLEGRQKRLEYRAAKEDDPKQRQQLTQEATEAANELAMLTPVVAPRLIVDDLTSEKLASLLVEQGGRIACMSAEGGVFDLMKGAYSKNGIPLFSVYLQGHAGDDIRVDRVSRPAEHVSRPAITMALAVQPEVIRGMADQPAFRGRGLLARFLYCLPQSTLGHRDVNPPAMPDCIAEDYATLVRTLCRLSPCQDNDGRLMPYYLQPSPRALDLLHEFIAEIEPELGQGGRLAGLQDWGGKLVGAVVRIAGVMHMIANAQHFNGWAIPVSPETMQSAITIGRYLTSHAEAAFLLLQTDRARADAEHILGWIHRHGRREFTRRELYQATKNRFSRAEDLDGPLEELVEHGIVRRKAAAEQPKQGRPAGPVFEVNPALFSDMSSSKRTLSMHPQYPQKSGIAEPLRNNGDIGGASQDLDAATGSDREEVGEKEDRVTETYPQYPQNSTSDRTRGIYGDIGALAGRQRSD